MPASFVDLALEVCTIMHAKLKMSFGSSSHLVYKHRNTSKEKKITKVHVFLPAPWALWHEAWLQVSEITL